MKKESRLYKKQEKRIVQLMYRKGIIDDLGIKLDSIIFDGGLHRVIVDGKYYYKKLPMLFYETCDYWGECDQHEVVDYLIDNIEDDWYYSEDAYLKGAKFKSPSRPKIIEYLSSLKTKRHDSKINKVLMFKETY